MKSFILNLYELLGWIFFYILKENLKVLQAKQKKSSSKSLKGFRSYEFFLVKIDPKLCYLCSLATESSHTISLFDQNLIYRTLKNF